MRSHSDDKSEYRYEVERVQKEEQNRRLIEEAHKMAERLIKSGHCRYCLTKGCSGHGISE